MDIKELIKMAHNYGCLYEGTLNEEYSEETLLKYYKKQLTLTNVSQQRELLIAELKEWDLGYTSFNNLEENLAEKLLKAINCR